jgi:hypothetical protein
VDAAVAYIEAGVPDLLFVHLDLIDAAGHAAGWGSAAYLAAIAEADALVGRLLDALDAQGVLGNTTVVVSADHGGGARDHGADQAPLRNVPLVVAGAKAAVGGRIEREVRIFDVAATLALLLGVWPVPPSAQWVATPVYEAAMPTVPPPPPPPTPPRALLTSNYTFVYATEGEQDGGASPPHSVWRPAAPAGAEGTRVAATATLIAVCMYVCMYVCMHACMYVCMCMCMCE